MLKVSGVPGGLGECSKQKLKQSGSKADQAAGLLQSHPGKHRIGSLQHRLTSEFAPEASLRHWKISQAMNRLCAAQLLDVAEGLWGHLMHMALLLIEQPKSPEKCN